MAKPILGVFFEILKHFFIGLASFLGLNYFPPALL
jgi:hypothetical protein